MNGSFYLSFQLFDFERLLGGVATPSTPGVQHKDLTHPFGSQRSHVQLATVMLLRKIGGRGPEA
jgi:hypothetical protein